MKTFVKQPHPEFKGFNHLKRITEQNTTPQRLKWLWDNMESCTESFDDFTRGKVDFFLEQFSNPANEFYEIGDAGLVVLQNILPGCGAVQIHYMIWDHNYEKSLRHEPALEIFDYLFYERDVHHVIGMIPINNRFAIRFALGIGMKFEGEIRESFLYKGRYYTTQIFGILEQEYPSRRMRLV